MPKFKLLVLASCTAVALSVNAYAGVSLNADRVGAKDVEATAKFYEAAFGLQEVNRFQMPNMLEILMNFGSTVAAAKANKSAQVVIMQRASDEPKDSMPHIILTVTDMEATLAAVKAAGGATDGPAKEFQHTGILIGFATDPAGNRLELIQQPKAAKKAKKP